MVKLNAYLLDMDGILYHGDSALPYAIDFMQEISDYPHVFVTNNPIKTPDEVAARLVTMGFSSISPDQVITSAIATAKWLSLQKHGFRYFAVGEAGLHHALSCYGIEDKSEADYVVVGEGKGLDYDSLNIGINLILKQNASLIGTNPDINVDTVSNGQHRILAGGGALLAPFQVATGVEPIIIGKPKALLFEMALEYLNEEAENCLMIGDRPDTDIAGAQALGIKTALVRTGRFLSEECLPASLNPDYDVDNLLQLSQQLQLKK